MNTKGRRAHVIMGDRVLRKNSKERALKGIDTIFWYLDFDTHGRLKAYPRGNRTCRRARTISCSEPVDDDETETGRTHEDCFTTLFKWTRRKFS